MSITKLPGSAIKANTITTTQLQTTVVNQITAGGGPRVTSLIYPGNDTAGNTAGGQTVYINGSGFETNNAIYINGNAVPSKAFISASNLSFTTPALSAGIYPVYVINTDNGATAIFIPGYVSSAEPTWVTGATLASLEATSAWNIQLSATGDGAITYALAGGSSLPAGITLAANGLISGTLSSPPAEETQYSFTVIASDAQNQDSTRQFSITASTGEGVLFANNVLLIHADGANNGNNHSFLDSSNNNFTITRNGNATQGSFSPFSQTGWSAYFDGSGDYLTLSSTSLNLSTNDFTIEAWVHTSSTSQQCIAGSIANGNGAGAWMFNLNYNSNKLRFYCRYGGGSSLDYQAESGTFPTNVWTHIAVTRSGANLRMFINGTQVGTTNTSLSTNSIDNATTTYFIGRTTDGASEFTGYISNLRVIKGTAQYTSNFTPSTTALTAVSNTSLLTCQSNRFIDNSTNAFTITRNGDTSIQAFSPFAPTAAYSTANVGGSGYFDGTTDSLTVPAGSAFAYGTGDFTVEGWFYATAEPVAYGSALFTQTVSGTNYFACFLGSDSISPSRVVRFQFGTSGGGTAITTSSTYNLNSWNHFAIVRNSGSVTVYLNGVGGTSGSCTQNFSDTSYVPTIGSYTHTNVNMLTGYLSNFRVVKGTAVYTSNFTPPTAPLTNIANTSLLCNFTNAQIFDQTAKNVLECVGNAKVSTSVYKYGTASMYFDGTGDYLKVVNPSTLFNLSTGDWTIECWINLSALTAEARIWSLGTYGSNPEVSLLMGGGGAGGTSSDLQLNHVGSGTLVSASSVNSTGVWAHVAAVRYSGTTTLYVNGISKGTTTSNPWTSSSTSLWIGGWSQNNSQMNGYIDDFRITKGYARYTSNFTPPTSALKDK